MQNLSDVFIRAAKPPAAGRLTIWDARTKRFGVRITSAGTKSFIVLLGSGRRQTIGHYPTISLAQAREKAKRILAERTLGRHQVSSISWQSGVQKFLDARRAAGSKDRTIDEYARTLKRYFAFGTIRVAEIGKRDISDKLEKLNHAPSQKAHALVVIKMFFRWALQEGYVELDPAASFKRAKQRKRKRVLSDAELKAVWDACDDQAGELPRAFRAIVRLLILAGQRRSETASFHPSWIKDNSITLPSSVTKNKHEHTFPIGAMSVSVLVPFLAAGSQFLFPARRRRSVKPFNGWSKAKAALDKRSGVTGWTLHDLRRTFRTIHARIGTPPHVAERLINHVNGVASDVEQIYDRHHYMPEMTKAVARYEEALMAILSAEAEHRLAA